jgi:glycine/D-amino acid oxidase-like deaminating enzyme
MPSTSVLDSDDTEQADLRAGRSPWFAAARHGVRFDVAESMTCDALIVGGGITGSLIAERLTRQNLNVVIIDRELPGRGSTAASTSMLLWEIDRSLAQLTETYGFERASRAYLARPHAVAGLKSPASRVPVPSCRRARRMRTRCNWRAGCSGLPLRAARGCSTRKR